MRALFGLILFFILGIVQCAELKEEIKCSLIGTRYDHGEILIGSGKRCFCKDGYTGSTCNEILNCMSGTFRQLNCTNPREEMEHKARLCAKGQEILNYCDCFIHYYGPRCEFSRRLGHLPVRPKVDEAQLAKPRPVPRVPEPELIPINSKEDIDLLMEEQMSRLNREFWFMIAIVLLLALIAICSIYIYFKIMKACHRIYLKNLWHDTLTRLGHAAVPLPKNLSDEETTDAPPSYNDVTGPLLPPPYPRSTASTLSESLSTVLDEIDRAQPSEPSAEEATEDKSLVRPLHVHV